MLSKDQDAPAISIIVATRNREVALARFLKALGRLPPVPKWEVVIADNGSVDGTANLLAAAARKLPIKRIYEPRHGKSRALNGALAVAKGDLLVFADDDITPSPRWLSALYDASLANPDVNIFGGKILVQRGRMPPWILNSYNLHALLLSEQDLGDKPYLFSFDRYPIGPNLAVRRCKVEDKGASWPMNLGPGTRIPVGDERAFLIQLSLPSDRDRLYVPNIVVVHSVSGRHLSVRKCLTRSFLGGFAAGAITRRFRHTTRGNHEGGKLVLQRIRQCSSFKELSCMMMRALGVLAGRLSPYPQLFESSAGPAARLF